MPMHLYIIVCMLACCISAKAQDTTMLWQTTIGNKQDDGSTIAQLTHDGSIVVSGSMMSDTAEPYDTDLMIAKADADGHVLWQRHYGGTDHDYGMGIEETAEGNFIIVGTTYSHDGYITHQRGDGDVWVVYTDATGHLLWQKTLGGTRSDQGRDVVQTADGGFLITAITESDDGDVSGNHGYQDIWVAKLDKQGNLQWQRCYGGKKYDGTYRIIPAPDGGYIICGGNGSIDGDFTGSTPGTCMIEIDGAGNIMWMKSNSNIGETYFTDIKATHDGGYILSGTLPPVSGVTTKGLNDIIVVKTDGKGNIQWQHNYGGSGYETGYGITVLSGGGYIVSGGTRSNDGDLPATHSITNGFDEWVIGLDDTGAIIWQKILGGTRDDYATNTIIGKDGNIICAGLSQSYDMDVKNNHGDTAGTYDVWLVKLATGIKKTDSVNKFKVYPIPATTTLYIEGIQTPVRIRLYDMLGQLLYTTRTTDYKTSVYTGNLAQGMYMLSLMDIYGKAFWYKVERS